ncbi:MAG: class I SAM-dependent RNA methyltransferase, partial [Pseudomonadota bacterium]
LLDAIEPVRLFLTETLGKKAKARVHLTQTDNGLDVHLEGVAVDSLAVLQAVPALAQNLKAVTRITGQDGPATDILWQMETPTISLSVAQVALPPVSFLQATIDG